MERTSQVFFLGGSMERLLRALVGSPAALAVVLGSHVHAAEVTAQRPEATQSVAPAAQSSTAGAASADRLETVTVTARRQDESLMAVPVAVTALSRETLEKYSTVDLQGIGNFAPTVIVANYKVNGGGSIAIRGISSPANQVGFEQAVAVAIDGVQTSNGQIAQLGFFDMQQVEVLKGPQALYFGKNNTAGVISITSAEPTDQFEGTLRTGWGFEAGESITDAIVSGPLTDTLSGRLALRYRHMDGWLTNTAGPGPNPFYNPATGAPASVATLPGATDRSPGESEFLGRVTLKYEPSDSVTATLRLTGDRQKDAGAGIYSQNIGPCVGPYPRTNGVPDPYGDCVADDRTTIGYSPPAIAATLPYRNVNADGSPGGELSVTFASLDIDARLGPNFTLALLTGYGRSRYIDYTGYDQTSFSQLVVYEDQTQEDISQELRLHSTFDAPLNFLIGGYFQHTTRDVYIDNKLSDAHYNQAVDRYTGFNNVTEGPGDTWSAFGQLIWDVTESVEAAAGARYTRETKDFRKKGLYGIGPFNVVNTSYPGSDQPGVLVGDFQDSNVSPEATLTWRPDSRHTLFAAYRTGFKSGGFGMTNPLQITSKIDGFDFGSETAHGLELGARGVFLDDRLSLSADLFDYVFEDLQVNIYDPATITYQIDNAGKVTQRGAELEANFLASEALTLHGAVAYVDNKFEDYTGQCYSYAFPAGTTRPTAVPPPNCSFVNETTLTLQQVYDGRTPARSPEWSGNVGFDLNFPLRSVRLAFTGDAYYSDDYYAADTLVGASLQDSYVTYSASASVSSSDDRWKASLIGRNLSDEHYLLYAVDRTGGAGVPGAIGEQRGVVSRGREVILQLELQF